jgi:fluoroquinolone transport system ATP-binding protein
MAWSSKEQAMLTVRDLRFTYRGNSQPAVRGMNFAVAEGEIFGFLGPSGAGKSTTQKILIRLLKEFEGEVTVLGRDLRTWGSNYYEQVGVSFELPNHYGKLTALENLQLFRALYQTPTEEPVTLLETVGLAQDANTRVAHFSKGMRMRLNFVRALLHRPKLLFLDEPTSGLDPVNARRVKEMILERKRQGATVFLTTHDMHVADELCDRVAFVVDGQIQRIDAPRALKLQFGQPTVQVEYCRNGQTEQQAFPLRHLGGNADFLTVIRTYPVETIHSQEATLEEIFVQVTGRSLT